MDTRFLLEGLAVGFAIAAPVGPIGVLCIHRTLAAGRLAGFVSGLGAATADALYGAIAAFGLTAISQALQSQSVWLRLVGGLFLCYLGARTFLSPPAVREATVKGRGLLAYYASTFGLTVTNPATIISFLGVFAGLGLVRAQAGYPSAALLVAGVFLGSASWWFVLSTGVSLVRHTFDTRRLRWVNRVSGVIVAGFGVAALVSLVG